MKATRVRAWLAAWALFAILSETSSMAQNNDAAITKADLDAWLGAYRQAWEQKDPAAAASLFAPDARYFETPYSEPFEGPAGVEAYWSRVTADQKDIRFDYDVIAVDGHTGVATWSVNFNTVSSGSPVELNGAFVLEFDGGGRCVTLREWWHAR